MASKYTRPVRPIHILLLICLFAAAGAASFVVAQRAVTWLESYTEIEMRRTLDVAGHEWAEVEADGLQVLLSGTAADEAARFVAMSDASSVVFAKRIRNGIEVKPTAKPEPPQFAMEMLRNDAGLSVVGLIPEAMERRALIQRLSRISGDASMSDLLQTARYPIPLGWTQAIDYALAALSELPRAKISVTSETIEIQAIAASIPERKQLITRLRRLIPAGLAVTLDISAPRPVITPFSLRYVMIGGEGHFDSCSADTSQGRERIISAALDAGLQGTANCVVGIGVPSPSWTDAVVVALNALAELGTGSITIANADVTFVAPVGTDQTVFDRIVGELDAALPAVFSLHPHLPVDQNETTGEKAEFFATLTTEGQVEMRGRLGDSTLRDVVTAYAQARFGSESVDMGARVADGLPLDWSLRVLSGLKGLSLLNHGRLTITPDLLTLTGETGIEDASAQISRLWALRLGDSQDFALNLRYIAPPPPPEEIVPDAKLCLDTVRTALAANKITFDPGSPTLASGSLSVVNEIAGILRDCRGVPLEIQGHTDSQGREEMNQQLSQARAQSVLNALRSRRVLTSGYVANGYGEASPIADNDTAEGREENRRIEFHLLAVGDAPATPIDAVDDTKVSDDTASAATTDAAADPVIDVAPDPPETDKSVAVDPDLPNTSDPSDVSDNADGESTTQPKEATE
jgi:OOP family OmpA-OmpF porin